MSHRRPLAALLLLFAAAGCAPPEATVPISARAASAPAPTLLPTAAFEAPRAEAATAGVELAADRDALAARAEALRSRGAALSARPVLAPTDRDRLEAAGATGDETGDEAAQEP